MASRYAAQQMDVHMSSAISPVSKSDSFWLISAPADFSRLFLRHSFVRREFLPFSFFSLARRENKFAFISTFQHLTYAGYLELKLLRFRSK